MSRSADKTTNDRVYMGIFLPCALGARLTRDNTSPIEGIRRDWNDQGVMVSVFVPRPIRNRFPGAQTGTPDRRDGFAPAAVTSHPPCNWARGYPLLTALRSVAAAGDHFGNHFIFETSVRVAALVVHHHRRAAVVGHLSHLSHRS